MAHLDAEIVMADIEDVCARLELEHANPAEVRRLFGQFMVLSQKLTSAMRKDFARIVGGSFQAVAFSGWTDVTEFFKRLRNIDLHDLPVTIEMRHAKYFPIEHNNPSLPALRMQFSYTQALPSQLTTHVPDTTSMEHENPDGSTTPIPWSAAEHCFSIEPRTSAVATALAKLPTTDVHILSAQCLATLREYYKYFQLQVRVKIR